MKKENSKTIGENGFSFLSKFGWTLLGCAGIYLIISLHFLLAVRTAHFLGDATYLPPSVLRYTSIFFRNDEISAFVEIVFLVFWVAFLGLSCWGLFYIALKIKKIINSFFFNGKVEQEDFSACFKTSFYVLLPVLILSLLTLSITPLRSNYYDTASMSEVAEYLPFSKFLLAMDEGTIAMFGVTLFVVLTLTTSFYLMKILPDNSPMFLFSIFLGVLVGVAVLMFLLPLGVKGFEFIKGGTANFFLAHFTLFGIYSIVSIFFVLPLLGKKKKTIGAKLPA